MRGSANQMGSDPEVVSWMDELRAKAAPCQPGAHRPLKALNPGTETCEVCGHATLIHDESGCYGCKTETTDEMAFRLDEERFGPQDADLDEDEPFFTGGMSLREDRVRERNEI